MTRAGPVPRVSSKKFPQWQKNPPPEGGGVCRFGLVVLDLYAVSFGNRHQLLEPLGVVAGEVEPLEELTADAVGVLEASGLERADSIAGLLVYQVVTGEVLRGSVVELVQVAVIAYRTVSTILAWVVPHACNALAHLVRNQASVGLVLQGEDALLLSDANASERGIGVARFGERGECLVDGVIGQQGVEVELLGVLLEHIQFFLKRLHTVGANKAKHTERKGHAQGAVKRVLQGEAEAHLVTHFWHFNVVALEVVIDAELGPAVVT